MCARDTEGSVPGRAGTPVSRLEERGSQATHLGSGSAEPTWEPRSAKLCGEQICLRRVKGPSR